MRTFFKWDDTSRFDAARAAAVDAAHHDRAVFRAVDHRDGRQCRACDRRTNPDAIGLLVRGHRHHLQYRSAGGPTESWNLVTLCPLCHADEHAHRLRIEGNADLALTFWRLDDEGDWYVARRELAVRVVEVD